MAREKYDAGDLALLEILLREKGGTEPGGVLADFRLAAKLGVGGATAKTAQLVEHLRCGTRGGFNQRGVELFERAANLVERGGDSGVGGLEAGLQVGRQAVNGDDLAENVRTVKKVGQGHAVLRHEALGARVDDSGAEARQYRRHPTENLFVDHGGLSEVRDFGRTSGVGKRGQQEILNHRAEKDVSAEAARFGLDAREKVVTRDFGASNLEAAVGTMNDDAGAVVFLK